MCGICHMYAMEDGAYIEADIPRKIFRPSDTHGRSLEEEENALLASAQQLASGLRRRGRRAGRRGARRR